MIDTYLPLITSLPQPFYHCLLITFLFWITWSYCLNPKWSFVIDDQQGVAAFSDRFVQTKDQDGNIVKEEKIDSYEQDVNGKKLKFGNFQFNPNLGVPACFNRWVRTRWGRTFKEIGQNSKGHKVYGYVQTAWKHHLLNLLVQYANCLLAYSFFSHIFNPQLALVTVLLFSVHPISVQVTGWISGVPYALGLLGTLIALNLSLHITNFFLLIPLISLFAAFSVLNMLPGVFTFIIMFLIGRNEAAFIYMLVGILVFLQQSNFVIKYRTDAFKEQQMGDSTRLYPRKIYVVLKTIWYYFKLIFFPKRLGLFHTYLYHFDETAKHFDLQSFLGIVSFIGCAIWYCFAPYPIKMGITWYFIYLIVFSNLITANQIVSERYIFFSLVGFSLILAFYLQNHPAILAFILGIYVMRVWVHLPTFANEVRFYESNCFNFPNSEVAMGNLGVAYLNHGMNYKAYDTWQEGARQNPLYDVPFYNLYSICKQNGDIVSAKKFLLMCLNAKTVHFPDQWTKEMKELDALLQQKSNPQRIAL